MFDPYTSIIIFRNNKLIGYVDSLLEAVSLCNFRKDLKWGMTEEMFINIPKIGSIEN
tara:strand:+ start:340 stop:510 length:171 start_codon:yes stop_codon:yes gene_type:complete